MIFLRLWNIGVFVHKLFFLSITALMFTLVAASAKADETITEKVEAAGNTTSRAVKKGAHRISETVCTKSDVACAAEKAQNRAVEAKDSVVDGAKKVGNKID